MNTQPLHSQEITYWTAETHSGLTLFLGSGHTEHVPSHALLLSSHLFHSLSFDNLILAEALHILLANFIKTVTRDCWRGYYSM